MTKEEETDPRLTLQADPKEDLQTNFYQTDEQTFAFFELLSEPKMFFY